MMKPSDIADMPLRPRVADALVPITILQRDLWNWSANGVSKMRECEASIRIVGALNIELLRTSIETVVQRHESLRTRIVLVEGTTTQQIDAVDNFYLETIDVSGTSPEHTSRAVEHLADDFASEKINLSVGPLFSAKLLRLSQYEHVLMLGVDHIVSDAASCSILRNDIWNTYRRAAQGLPPSLPYMPLQFADYAVWQQNSYSAWREKHAPYWWDRLSGVRHIELPFFSSSAVTNDFAWTMAEFPLGKSVSKRLTDIAFRERALLPLVVFTIVAAVVSQWIGQKNFVVTFSTHGRHARPQLANMIGFLAAPMYLRVEIGDGDSFIDVLRRLSQEFSSALEHQDFGRVPDLISECDETVRFNWAAGNSTPASDQLSAGGEGANDIQAHRFPIRKKGHNASRISPIKLFFAVWPGDVDSSAGIVMRIGYQVGTFAAGAIEQLGRNLQHRAEDFAERPTAVAISPRVAR